MIVRRPLDLILAFAFALAGSARGITTEPNDPASNPGSQTEPDLEALKHELDAKLRERLQMAEEYRRVIREAQDFETQPPSPEVALLTAELGTARRGLNSERSRFQRFLEEVAQGKLCPVCGRARSEFAWEEGFLRHRDAEANSPSADAMNPELAQSKSIDRSMQFAIRIRDLESRVREIDAEIQRRTAPLDKRVIEEQLASLASRRDDLTVEALQASAVFHTALERQIRQAVLVPRVSMSLRVYRETIRRIVDRSLEIREKDALPNDEERIELRANVTAAVDARATLLAAILQAQPEELVDLVPSNSQASSTAAQPSDPTNITERVLEADLAEFLALRTASPERRAATLIDTAASIAGDPIAHERERLRWLETVASTILESERGGTER